MSKSGSDIELELRFHAGQTYCCAEPGCFLATYDRRWWIRVRSALAEMSERDPPPFTVRVRGVVEAGARLNVLRALGISPVSPAYNYECTAEAEPRQ